MSTRFGMRAILASLLLGAAACGHSTTPAAGVITTDSAGIAVVENADVAPPGGLWTVDSVPVTSIGTENGPEEYQFTGISAVVETPGGGCAVADGSNSIRFFDGAGKLLARVGRDGDGPGEYRHISLMGAFAGDSLLVWDFPARRLSILAPGGRYVRSAAGPDLPGFFFPRGVFADGSVLGEYTPPLEGGPVRSGLLHGAALYLRFDWRNGKSDTLARIELASSYVRDEGHPTILSIPFAANPVAAVAGEAFYLGTGARFEAGRYEETGRLAQIVRLKRQPAPLTRALIADLVEKLARRAPTEGARILVRQRYADIPYPRTLPAYQAMLVGALGDLWVEAYRAEGSAPSEWIVLDSSGRLTGEVRLPPAFDPWAVYSDRILGVTTDSAGVERVEALRLLRGHGPGAAGPTH